MDKKEFSQEELDNIKKALKGWENVTLEQVQVTAGWGLCNYTYIVKALDSQVSPPAVFYRVFRDIQGAKDRDRENKIFKAIAEKGLGPQCHGATLEYRIEEYIPSHVVGVKELHTPQISRQIAKWQAGLHKQNFDFLGLDKKATKMLNLIEGGDFIKRAKEVLHTMEFNEEDQKVVDLLKTKVTEEEWNSLKEMLPKGEKAIRFCHNDPNIGNIIIVEATGKPMLVDYENAGYDYRGLDIGAFMALSRVNLVHPEPPYIHVDYSKFSTDEDMRGYIRRYLLFFRHDWNTIDEEKAFVDDEYLKEYIIKNDNLEDFEEEVEQILRETYVGVMLNQMFATLMVITMDIKGLPYSKYLMTEASYKIYMEFKEKAKASPLRE